MVQFVRSEDRSCSAAAQLGSLYVRGRYMLQIDGDMEMRPEFIPAALAALRADHRLAGVGGLVNEMSTTTEFRERRRRRAPQATDGTARRLTGIALYRAEAIRQVGYFTDRNLYCHEELELGMRLRALGWRLTVLGVVE